MERASHASVTVGLKACIANQRTLESESRALHEEAHKLRKDVATVAQAYAGLEAAAAVSWGRQSRRAAF